MLRQVHKENRLTERRNEEKLVSVELDMKFPHSEIKISMWSIIKIPYGNPVISWHKKEAFVYNLCMY